MAKIILSEGQPYVVPGSGLLRFEAFTMGTQDADVQLELKGTGSVNNLNPTTVLLASCTGPMSLMVRPRGEREFGPETAVRVMAKRRSTGESEMVLEFPLMPLAGVGECLLARLVPVGSGIEITPQSASVISGIDSSAMSMVAALRPRVGEGDRALEVEVILDTTASMSSPDSAGSIKAAAATIAGSCSALGASTVAVRAGLNASTVCGLPELEAKLLEVWESRHLAVGGGVDLTLAGLGHIGAAQPGTLRFLVSDTLCSAEMTPDTAMVHLLVGPTAAAEYELAERVAGAGGYQTHCIVVDHDLDTGMSEGQSPAIAKAAAVVEMVSRRLQATA
ncbi:hypothetical protein [Corynebacterium heidelbergense]|uniref:Uncharacterized protein n=1 Tax=Corynebacterium heidelbergense TaxID=2055947 RepID=A0A364V8X3_9CORY|nr:hypothetical protein [Corynebacterium heidelbergense]RAV33064.1 hypothetical protein DLJ54_00515 [Corynebacterium heidelbergense]